MKGSLIFNIYVENSPQKKWKLIWPVPKNGGIVLNSINDIIFDHSEVFLGRIHPKKGFPSSIGFPLESSWRNCGFVLSGTGNLEQSVVVVNVRSRFVSGGTEPGGGG